MEPTGLSGGASSRDALVRLFVRALEKRDTAALARLTLNRSEFAFRYYPTNPQSLPPYDQSPGLMWFMLDKDNQRGVSHLLEERGGRPLGFVSYICESGVSVQGENRVWGPCFIRRERAGGDTVSERLFGPIVERAGRYKFVSLSNRL